ncbi:hypothetical protein [Pseudomonas syringae pv. coryli]|uniref:hypothetical protein n=1 Tax=Pseudomonas syringae pv. coryli TaxID=317659 RepID=UPI003D2D79BF
MTNKLNRGMYVSRECRECGSSALIWFADYLNTSGVAEGRLRTNEVSCSFVLGCEDCSETLAVVKADDFPAYLTELQLAQAGAAKVDESAEFEEWRKEQIASLVRMGYPDAAKAFRDLGSVQWAGWQARAKLNTPQ